MPPPPLPPLPTISQLLAIYGLSAKKQLSQNFILNETLLRKISCRVSCMKTLGNIVRYLQVPLSDNLVVEIGPGPGGLTREILRLGPKRLITIEKDERFKPSLKQLEDAFPNRIRTSFSDAKDLLQLPGELLTELPEIRRIQVIGNLPFGVASIILLNLLKSISTPSDTPLGKLLYSCQNVEFLLMFQKEVAERIAARPGHSERSRLSVLAQHYCETELCMHIPAKSFVPRPAVDAAVVRLVKRPSFQIPFDELKTTVQQLFMYPRKTLKTSLRIQQLLLQGDQLPATIPTDARPGTLTHTQILAMVKWFKSRKEQILPKTL